METVSTSRQVDGPYLALVGSYLSQPDVLRRIVGEHLRKPLTDTAPVVEPVPSGLLVHVGDGRTVDVQAHLGGVNVRRVPRDAAHVIVIVDGEVSERDCILLRLRGATVVSLADDKEFLGHCRRYIATEPTRRQEAA